MQHDRQRDGSPEAVFGAELRYYREQAGLSQTDLAALVNISNDVISKIETGSRPPADDFPPRLDLVAQLDTRDALTRLWKQLRTSVRHRAYPGWFDRWPDAEAAASVLRSYQPLLVPGLLQTEDYARAVLRGAQVDATDEQVEQQVAARLARQDILSGPTAPHFSAVLDEGVLHRAIGDQKIMHDQLVHVVDASARPKMSIQVIPYEAGARTGLLGAFALADHDSGSSLLYLETATMGQVVEVPSVIREAVLIFDTLRSEALPRGASRDLIMKVAEERWT